MTYSLSGWDALDQGTRDLFNATYGPGLAPFVWMQQSGNAGTTGFGALPPEDISTWFGQYGNQAPEIWAQQSGYTPAAAVPPTLTASPPSSGIPPSRSLASGSPIPTTWGTGAPVNMNWVYDVVQTGQGWMPVRRGPQTNWGNVPIPDSDQSQEANYARRQAGVPQAFSQYVTPGQSLFSVTENAGEAGGAFLRSDNPYGSGLSTGIDNYTPAAFQDFIARYQAGKIIPNNPTAKSLGDAIVAGQITPQQLASMANSPMTSAQLTPGSAGGTGAAGAAGGGSDAYSQLLAQQNAAASATQAAQLAYQNAILKHYSDQDALAAAEFAYKQTYEAKIFDYQKEQDAKNFAISEAGLTGTYNGQPTTTEQQRQFANAITAAGMTGTYNGQPTTAEQQRQFANAITTAGVTGTYNGQPTFAAQQANNATALSLLGMNAQLSGPSNYLTYLRTLSNTPQGLTDIVNSLAGKFNLSSLQSQVPGSAFERQSAATLARDLNDASRTGLMDASGAVLPAGSQWNPRNFSILAKNPTQLGLTKNLYQESGRDWNTEYANFLSSLPKFGGPQQGAVSLA